MAALPEGALDVDVPAGARELTARRLALAAASADGSADRGVDHAGAPAKVNLDLRMRGRRADGYHLLRTVLQSIALADTLTLRRAPRSVRASPATPPVCPTDARNLAWKGAAAMAAHLGVPLDGWELALEKHVPAEAGLGGGSADAAAAARLVASAAGRSSTPRNWPTSSARSAPMSPSSRGAGRCEARVWVTC